jgi:hypothetical protein
MAKLVAAYRSWQILFMQKYTPYSQMRGMSNWTKREGSFSKVSDQKEAANQRKYLTKWIIKFPLAIIYFLFSDVSHGCALFSFTFLYCLLAVLKNKS